MNKSAGAGGNSLPRTPVSMRRGWEVVCQNIHSISFFYFFFILGLKSCCYQSGTVVVIIVI